MAFDVSDPCDFGTEHGTGPFAGSIEATTPQALLVRLKNPLTYTGLTVQFVVATARHVDKPLEMIADQVAVPANLTPVQVTPGSSRR